LTKLPAIAFQGPRRRTAQSFEALGSSGLKYCLRDRGKGLLFFAHPATKLSRTDAANSGCTLKRHIERLHAALFFDKMKRGHQMISSHRCHWHFRSREHFGRVRRCRGLERCFRTLEFFRARDDRVPFPQRFSSPAEFPIAERYPALCTAQTRGASAESPELAQGFLNRFETPRT